MRLVQAGWAVMLAIRISGSRDRAVSPVSCLDLDWYLQITPTILLMSKWTGYLMAGTDLQTGANSANGKLFKALLIMYWYSTT